MIVRLVLWRLDERTPPVEELRDRLDELEPLTLPSTFLVNEGAEQIGMLAVADDDEPAAASARGPARPRGTRARPLRGVRGGRVEALSVAGGYVRRNEFAGRSARRRMRYGYHCGP